MLVMNEEISNFRTALKLAILIDADNISAAHIKDILAEITKDGIPVIKRIYGDWTDTKLNKWKDVLLEHAIQPIQQYSYTTGKNATDSAMIIDAMDILHKEHVDGFCIVSSDSDFTKLATRLRESGKLVIGIGEQKTPKPFIVSCNKFIYVEILQHTVVPETAPDSPKVKGKSAKARKTPAAAPKPSGTSLLAVNDELKSLLVDTVRGQSDETGWAYLANVGNNLQLKKPDFDSRNYGFDKLAKLFRSLDSIFETDERSVPNKKTTNIYVRIKE